MSEVMKRIAMLLVTFS